MHRRTWSRALIALAAPVLIVSAGTTAATAAATAEVPTVEAAAEIYTHFEGGSSYESTGKVYGPGKKCKPGKAIKGASSKSASYSPDYSSGDPDAYAITGERPAVSVTAMKFPSAKAAIQYLHGYDKTVKDCPGGGSGGGGGGGGDIDCKTAMKKIKFSLGDERKGYQFKSTCKIGQQTTTSVFNTLFVRKGKFIVYANMMSMDASAPSIPKSIDFTELALKTVS